MSRRALGPAAVVIAVAVVTWLVAGVTLFDIARFLAYEFVFVALPGIVLSWAVCGHRPAILPAIAIGWPLGQTLEILAFAATAAADARWLFLIYPVVVIGASVLVIRSRRRGPVAGRTDAPMSIASMWAAAATLSVGLVYLALMFLPQAPLPSQTSSVAYNVDFVFFIGLIAQALHHWPLTSPGLAGVPLHYEWFVFLHMAAVSQVTHLAIPTVALRLDYVPTMVVLGCQLLALGRLIGRSAWIGVLAIGVLFALGSLDLTTNLAGAPFVESFVYHLWASWTIPFGLTFLLALLYLIHERLQATSWRKPGDLGAWALIVILMVGASGAKATILPVVVAGTGLYCALALVTRRRLPANAVVAFGLGIVVFAVTFLIVYGTGVPGTVIDPFASLSGTLPMVAATGITNSLIRHVVLPFAYVAGLAGVLLPLTGALYMLRRRHRGELARYALCLCMFAAGLIISNVVHQISYSEQYFLDTGFIAGCIVAAAGLRLAWIDAGVGQWISRRAVVITLAASLVLLVAVIGATALSFDHDDAVVARYAILGAGCIGLVIAWRLVALIRHRPAPGVALAMIPLLAASALTSPILVAPVVKRVLAGLPATITTPDPQEVWGLTPGLLTALSWLRDSTPTGTVLAVSNHWINPAETDGRNYYYSAFSEREVFVEAYDPVRFGVAPGVDTQTERDFVYRQQLNNDVFNHADTQALALMTQRYAVRFLFVDRLHGTFDPSVVDLGHVVFTSPAAIIIAVG